MTASEILSNILAYYGMSNNSLAAELGVHHTRIDNIINGKTKTITKSTADLLLKHFPTLNPDYVIKGREPMHTKKANDFTRLSTSEMISLIMQQYQILGTADLARKIGWKTNIVSAIRIGQQYQQFTVSKVKQICKAFPELNPNWLLCGYGNMFKSNRQIDSNLPMPAPVRVNNKKGEIPEPKSEAPATPAPTPTPSSEPTQTQINQAILEELKRLHEEINELRNNNNIGFAAETPNKD